MNLLDNIIDINISKETLGIDSAGFNTLLIIGNSKGDIRVKSYNNMIEISDDYDSDTPEYVAASLAFGQSIKLQRILIGQVFEDETYEQAYLKILQEDSSFYGVMIDSKKEDDQIKIANLVETDNKIFGISTGDTNVLDKNNTENVLHKLKELNKQRTFVIYNSQANDEIYPEAAWFGLMLTKDAGSATWAFKSLSGIKTDNLSSNDISALDSKNSNYFCALAGRNIMFNGKVVSGEYIDVITGLDWVTDDLKTQIGNALIQTDKIEFTNQGIAIIESMIRNSLSKAASRNIIDRETIIVNVPDIRTISTSNKKARILPDVKFEARLSGAIHKLKIQGTITI